MAYTLEQLQKMGATPVAKTATPSSGGYTLQQLQGMGAKPVASAPTAPSHETSGALFPSSPDDSALTAGLKTAGNIPGSAWGFAKGIVSMMNPVNIAKNITSIPGEVSGLVKDAGGVKNALTSFGKAAPKATYEGLIPEGPRQLLSGDFEGAQKSFTNDPVGSVAPVVLGAKGVAGGLGKGAAFDAALSKTAQVITKPVEVAAKKAGGTIGRVAGDTTRFGVSQATGLKPETVSQVVKNPEAFSKEAMADVSRETIGREIESKLNEKLAALEETGKGYQPVRDLQGINREVASTDVKVVKEGGRSIVYDLLHSPIDKLTLPELRRKAQMIAGDPSAKALLTKTNKEIAKRETAETIPHKVNVSPKFFDNVIKSTTGVEIQGGKIRPTGTSNIRDAGDIRALQYYADFWRPIFAKGFLTVDEMLNFRSDLAKAAKFEKEIGTRTDVQKATGIMRAKFNEKYRGQVPGLEALDLDFSTKKGEFNRLKDELFDKNNQLKKSATDKIVNSLGRGQRKADFLDKLEEISPGITKKIEILKAIEDIQDSSGIKVGTYTRGVLLGGTAILSGIVPAAVSAILTSPASAVPIMRRFGLMKNSQAVQQVLKQLGSAASNVNGIPSMLNMDVKKLEGVKVPMGLSIEDVSKKTPEQIARENFDQTWSKAYGDRPATVESPSLLQQRKQARNTGLREGQPPVDGRDFNEVVARERFDIPNLKKVSFGGSDRDVYELPDGNVLKVSKTSRGLSQNDFSHDYYAEDAGLTPKTIEVGKNYVVKEKVDPPDAQTKAMVKDIEKILPFDKRSNDYYAGMEKLREKYEDVFSFSDLSNYDVLVGDLKVIRNWGTRNGSPILLDEGTLNGGLITNHQKSGVGGKNLNDPEFRDIYNRSRAAKKKFGDKDSKTMYGIGVAGGATLLGTRQDQ